MILKKIPASERPVMRLKILAADALQGKRKEWGFGNSWAGNYLAMVSVGRN